MSTPEEQEEYWRSVGITPIGIPVEELDKGIAQDGGVLYRQGASILILNIPPEASSSPIGRMRLLTDKIVRQGQVFDIMVGEPSEDGQSTPKLAARVDSVGEGRLLILRVI